MRIDIDLTAGAFYITLGGGKVSRTVEVSPTLLVDLTEDGTVAGIDVLTLDAVPVDEVLAAYPLPDRQAAQLRSLAESWVRPQMQVA